MPGDIIIFTNVYHKWQYVWFLRYRVRQTLWTIFCSFTLLWTQKIKILKKRKTRQEILSFYKYVLWMTIIYVWFLRHRARRAEFFVILDDFLLFYPTNKPRKSRFWRTEKKMPGDIAILYKCTKISDGCNFYFSFWAIFCLFTSPPTTQTIKILKIWKKVPRDIIILHMCTKYNDHTM